MYVFHSGGTLVPSLIPYKKLLEIKKHSGRKEIITYKISWLRTLVYFKRDWTQKQLFSYVKKQGFDLDEHLVQDRLKKFKETINDIDRSPNKKRILIFIKKYYIWDEGSLNEKFNTTEEISKYKKTTVCQQNNHRRGEKNESKVLNRIQYNPSITINDLVRSFERELSRKTVLKILRKNNINLRKQSKTFEKIERKLDEIFKYKIDRIDKVLTNQLLSEVIGVKKLTLQRYFNDNLMYRDKVKSFNKTLRERKKLEKKINNSNLKKKSFDF